jgi:hypothetical protein
MTIAEVAAALGNSRRESDGYRCRCPLASEHNRTGGEGAT